MLRSSVAITEDYRVHVSLLLLCLNRKIDGGTLRVRRASPLSLLAGVVSGCFAHRHSHPPQLGVGFLYEQKKRVSLSSAAVHTVCEFNGQQLRRTTMAVVPITLLPPPATMWGVAVCMLRCLDACVVMI